MSSLEALQPQLSLESSSSLQELLIEIQHLEIQHLEIQHLEIQHLEIQQTKSASPEAIYSAMLYDKLGQIYSERILSEQSDNLKQEKENAIAAFKTAIVEYQKLNQSAKLVNVLRRLAQFLLAQSCYEEAIDFYQQSLGAARQDCDRSSEMKPLHGLGLAYTAIRKPQQAIDYLLQALELQREFGDRLGEASSLNSLGLSYDGLRLFYRAINLHRQALEIVGELGDRTSEVLYSMNLGVSLVKANRTEEAIEVYQSARSLALDLGMRSEIEQCDRVLKEIEVR